MWWPREQQCGSHTWRLLCTTLVVCCWEREARESAGSGPAELPSIPQRAACRSARSVGLAAGSGARADATASWHAWLAGSPRLSHMFLHWSLCKIPGLQARSSGSSGCRASRAPAVIACRAAGRARTALPPAARILRPAVEAEGPVAAVHCWNTERLRGVVTREHGGGREASMCSLCGSRPTHRASSAPRWLPASPATPGQPVAPRSHLLLEVGLELGGQQQVQQAGALHHGRSVLRIAVLANDCGWGEWGRWQAASLPQCTGRKSPCG